MGGLSVFSQKELVETVSAETVARALAESQSTAKESRPILIGQPERTAVEGMAVFKQTELGEKVSDASTAQAVAVMQITPRRTLWIKRHPIGLVLTLGLVLLIAYGWISAERDAARFRDNAGREFLLSNIQELSDPGRHPEGYPGDEHKKAVDIANASEFPPGHQPSLDLLDSAWLYWEPEIVIWRLCIYTSTSVNPFLGTAEQTSPYEVLQGSMAIVAGVTGCDPRNLDNPKTREQYQKNDFADYCTLYAWHRKTCCHSHREAIQHIIARWEHFKRTGQP
jgi:hypothetical protein